MIQHSVINMIETYFTFEYRNHLAQKFTYLVIDFHFNTTNLFENIAPKCYLLVKCHLITLSFFVKRGQAVSGHGKIVRFSRHILYNPPSSSSAGSCLIIG